MFKYYTYLPELKYSNVLHSRSNCIFDGPFPKSPLYLLLLPVIVIVSYYTLIQRYSIVIIDHF